MAKIGLEIHGYLMTSEKLFCRCKSEHGKKHSKPNTNVCPICTGQPGAKPMLPNQKAVDKVIKIALILGCKINEKLAWQRKHYSWPDLPKGYQNTISGPYASPVGKNGKFRGIGIIEAHLEEDPAAWNPNTGEIDYNRSGSPLIEIVTEPNFQNSKEAVEWLKKLMQILSYAKAIDKNSGIKADVNVSVSGGKRIEIKNINSMKNIKTAIEYEILRQEKSPPKEQETRMFNETEGVTIKMRSKEQAQDYRFISDPDLPVIKIKKERIKKIKSVLPETPDEKLKKLIKEHKIEKKYAEILTKKVDIAEFFEEVIKRKVKIGLATRWVAGELLSVLNYNKKNLDDHEINIKPEHFSELLKLIEQNKITELKAKEILRKFIPESFSPKEQKKEFEQISKSSEIKKIVETAIKENPKAVQDYKSGQEQALNFLIGQVMKLSEKRADYKTAKELLKKELK